MEGLGPRAYRRLFGLQAWEQTVSSSQEAEEPGMLARQAGEEAAVVEALEPSTRALATARSSASLSRQWADNLRVKAIVSQAGADALQGAAGDAQAHSRAGSLRLSNNQAGAERCSLPDSASP